MAQGQKFFEVLGAKLLYNTFLFSPPQFHLFCIFHSCSYSHACFIKKQWFKLPVIKSDIPG